MKETGRNFFYKKKSRGEKEKEISELGRRKGAKGSISGFIAGS